MSANQNFPLLHKKVAATGKLRKYTRKVLMAILKERGAYPVCNVSRRTDYQCLGGTAADKLAKQGRSRPDGKSLSRVAQLIPANKGDFLFIADSGPGETNAKGLIVPKFGNKPENHVAVNMTFESLSEFFLMTKMHYQMWLASWYVHNPIRPVSKQQVQSQSNHIEPNSNAVPMF